MQNGRMQNGKMQNGKFELITTCGNARRGRMHTVHGEIETPVFMNVGTAAAIRGGAGTDDLRRIGCQVELAPVDLAGLVGAGFADIIKE